MIGALLGANAGGTQPGPGHPFWYSDDPSLPGMDGVTADSSMRINTVYACVKVLAESVASLPLILYRRRSDGGKDRAHDHPLYDLLHDAPNGWNTAVEFFELGMYHLCLRGNMLARKVEHSDGVEQLLPVNPDDITRAEIKSSRVRYKINGEWHWSDNFLHVRGLSPDSVWGMSPIKHLQKSLQLSKAAEDFGERYFANGIRPAGALEFPNPLSDKAYERLRNSVAAEHAGQQHKAMILEEGGKWSQISIAPEEAQFLETRQFQVAEICRMFRVPPHMVQDLTRATFGNIEHQGIDFVVHTVRPWLVKLEQAIRRDVIRESGLHCEFLADALMRGDTAARYAAYSIGVTNEFLSPNEVRGFENLNPRDGGDEFKNPAINPKTEQAASDTAGDQSDKFAAAFAKDIAGRISSREIKELEKRAKHAKEDAGRWDAWLHEFYDAHARFIDGAVANLCDCFDVQASARVELVQGLVKSSLSSMRAGDPDKTVAQWSTNESRASEYAQIITRAVL